MNKLKKIFFLIIAEKKLLNKPFFGKLYNMNVRFYNKNEYLELADVILIL